MNIYTNTALPLSSFNPVTLKYSYYDTEIVNGYIMHYNEGFNFIKYPALENFQDFAINKNTGMILTSSVGINQFFNADPLNGTVSIPRVCYLQPYNKPGYYLYPSITSNIVTLSSAKINLNITVNDNNTIYIQFGEYYFQVDPVYPYQIKLSRDYIDPSLSYLRQFKYVYENGTIKIAAQITPSDTRFLDVGLDSILRATGYSSSGNYQFTMFGDVATSQINKSGSFRNDWVVYESGTGNAIQTTSNVRTHYLIDFIPTKAITDGEININIANLKTNYTPAGAIGLAN